MSYLWTGPVASAATGIHSFRRQLLQLLHVPPPLPGAVVVGLYPSLVLQQYYSPVQCCLDQLFDIVGRSFPAVNQPKIGNL
jgi:hypothetical protein